MARSQPTSIALRHCVVEHEPRAVHADGTGRMTERVARKSKSLPSVVEWTRAHDKWLASEVPLVPADLRKKHREMRKDAFRFLRATYYRWAEIFPVVCRNEAKAPSVLAIGDLHVENFGTWRDAEGRLVWGVNDFDEASRLPYTNDLVRLATSIRLAIRKKHLRLSEKIAVSTILSGYRSGLEDGGHPFVLAESHDALREMARHRLYDTSKFWRKVHALKPYRGRIPTRLARSLIELLPEANLRVRFRRRVAGLGSLGRLRIVAIAEWRGGLVLREAKALCPSAAAWASGRDEAPGRAPREVLARAVRAPDPFLHVKRHWILRRLAPDCTGLELTDLPAERAERDLFDAMGRETANVHLGSGNRRAILRDLRSRRPGWLALASEVMTQAVDSDWQAWWRSTSRGRR
jgi:uncharacterized protein DUF2252